MDEKLLAFGRLLKIMDELREKCPWDQKQTFETLRHLSIEEVYELADAIMRQDSVMIKKELGDILLHIVFYAKIGSEKNEFDITDVINGICEKLIHRHPHIYGDVKVENAEDVKQNWEKLKLKEGNTSVLGGVPVSLPALIKAMRIQEKSGAVGFDWNNAGQVWNKVEEEMGELQAEVSKMDGGKSLSAEDKEKLDAEFGDLLFSLVNYSRYLNVNPEEALEKTNRKFIRRFLFIEEKAKTLGKPLDEMSLEEMDVYWNEAKKQE
jgi:XTP/dITP diphosphohydrolase